MKDGTSSFLWADSPSRMLERERNFPNSCSREHLTSPSHQRNLNRHENHRRRRRHRSALQLGISFGAGEEKEKPKKGGG